MYDEKVWFITEASEGFGLALAKSLLLNGQRVAALSGNKEILQRFTGGLTKNLLTLSADLTSEHSVKTAIQRTIQRFGRIDRVVNNAGYDILDEPEEFCNTMMRKNFELRLFGPFHVLRQVMPYLQDQRSGHIINFSSPSGSVVPGDCLICTATKLAIESLSEAFTADMENFGIRMINMEPMSAETSAMSPGVFRTRECATAGAVAALLCLASEELPVLQDC